jgi:hypothetical protein
MTNLKFPPRFFKEVMGNQQVAVAIESLDVGM